MKLVVTYSHGDGCTWYADETVPIEYESGEALLVDLEEHVKEYQRLCKSNWREAVNQFKNTEIHADDLLENGIYYPPTVRTLEEWWNDEAGNE